MLLAHQHPVVIDAWGNEKRFSISFGQGNIFHRRRVSYWNAYSFCVKCKKIITGLQKKKIVSLIGYIDSVVLVCMLWDFKLLFRPTLGTILCHCAWTWAAGSSRGSRPGSWTVTGLLSMLSSFSWLWEADGKVGNVFWNLSDIFAYVFYFPNWCPCLQCMRSWTHLLLLTSISIWTTAAQTKAIAAIIIPTAIRFRGLLNQH